MADMDAILDEALDELDDDDNVQEDSSASSPKKVDTKSDKEHHASPSKNNNNNNNNNTNDSLPDLFQAMMRDFAEVAETDENDVDAQLKNGMNHVDAHLPPQINPSSSSKGKEEDNIVEDNLAILLEEMAKASLDDNTGGGGGDDFLKGLLGAAAGGDSGFNSDAMIDGMMEQLLSKDLMYEPMKQVTQKFPEWLEENKSSLSSKDYEERCKQYDCFKKLVHMYETNPQNFSQLLELMQQVQEYGQPPQEIIQDIAPGLELDEDGMPKMNPMMPGLGGGDEDCRMM